VDDASRILPTLFIGRAPATAADVAGLKRRGISAVLSLQTDEDLAALGLSWNRLEEWYRARPSQRTACPSMTGRRRR